MANLIATGADDALLAYITTNGTRLDICSSQPAVYADIATYTLGNKTSIGYTGPAAGSPSGRKVTVNAISGGSVTGNGTAAYWAISDASSILVATGQLSSSQAVVSGNTFSLTAFDITVPQPA